MSNSTEEIQKKIPSNSILPLLTSKKTIFRKINYLCLCLCLFVILINLCRQEDCPLLSGILFRVCNWWRFILWIDSYSCYPFRFSQMSKSSNYFKINH